MLFSAPDLLLLDEPTNYLDLEGTLWLVDYLQRYPGTILVISHDRDLLDAVADHILHLDQAKLTLWRGNYSGFEKQRREQQAIQVKLQKKQDDQRKHLQAFVDRFRAKATKAAQAQSRLKMLAKLEPIAAIVDGHVLPFDLPSPQKPLSPPIVAMENVAAGYDGHAGAATSLARRSRMMTASAFSAPTAMANRPSPSSSPAGSRRCAAMLRRSSKLDVGFFAQHQVDDLDLDGHALSMCRRAHARCAGSRRSAPARAQMGFPERQGRYEGRAICRAARRRGC